MNERSATTPEVFDGKPVIRFRDESHRRSFLKTAAIIGAGSTLVAVSRRDPKAFADATTNDLEILNYALTLEYLEAEFYTKGLEGDVLTGRTRDLIEPIEEHENKHVEVVTQTIKDLGGKPVKAPKVKFDYADTAAFTALAETLENTGVSAYNGVAPEIKSKDVLAAAGSIVQVEARHAAAIALANNSDPAPDAFDPTLTQEQVLKAVTPFLVK